MDTQEIQNMEIDLMSISPDWFYRDIPWNRISKLCNVRSWQGTVKKGEETLAASSDADWLSRWRILSSERFLHMVRQKASMESILSQLSRWFQTFIIVS